jgi:hypothetical protein
MVSKHLCFHPAESLNFDIGTLQEGGEVKNDLEITGNMKSKHPHIEMHYSEY